MKGVMRANDAIIIRNFIAQLSLSTANINYIDKIILNFLFFCRKYP